MRSWPTNVPTLMSCSSIACSPPRAMASAGGVTGSILFITASPHGYDKDKPRNNAWPYRDYVIAALNNDKPYSRFVLEQLAGDVLFPDDPAATIATGFVAAALGISSGMSNFAKGRPTS